MEWHMVQWGHIRAELTSPRRERERMNSERSVGEGAVTVRIQEMTASWITVEWGEADNMKRYLGGRSQ